MTFFFDLFIVLDSTSKELKDYFAQNVTKSSRIEEICNEIAESRNICGILKQIKIHACIVTLGCRGISSIRKCKRIPQLVKGTPILFVDSTKIHTHIFKLYL